MRSMAMGVFLGAVFVVVASGWLQPVLSPNQVHAQIPTSVGSAPRAGSELIAFSEAGEGGRQIILIDPRTRIMGVYHVDGLEGKIQLRSVRNLFWDLHIEDFNGAKPSPGEVRAMVETR